MAGRCLNDSVRRAPLSIAPMMDRTDRHFRYFMRKITRRTLLYTEMVTTQAILQGDRQKLLGFNVQEKPLVLQLGGDNPQKLAQCARIGELWGYDEINLNVGCPSPRVQGGNFGACLMTQPGRVADAIAAMKAVVNIPVTVKHRIGVDEQDDYSDLRSFVEQLAAAGCNDFTVHARKAWLQGLSPKENRTVPPLRYADVYQLKRERSDLFIEINGGIVTLADALEHRDYVDAVMIGRAAYDNPYLFAIADRDFFDEEEAISTRREVALSMVPYLENWSFQQPLRLYPVIRPMLQLFAGQPGSKAWKRFLSEKIRDYRDGAKLVLDALAQVP
ncbi:MAG: tRNA dihydrouridine(20/20a) synthase DusA [Cyanobacteria bacterium P01_H01_bin.15]